MVARPESWQAYYHGDEEQKRFARQFSLSDRMRYYWTHPTIQAAQHVLLANLGEAGIPLPLLSAHLPGQYDRVRRGQLAADPRSLVIDRVRDVLRDYAAACRARADG